MEDNKELTPEAQAAVNKYNRAQEITREMGILKEVIDGLKPAANAFNTLEILVSTYGRSGVRLTAGKMPANVRAVMVAQTETLLNTVTREYKALEREFVELLK